MFIDATGLTEEELREGLIEAGVCDHDIEIALKHIREMEGDITIPPENAKLVKKEVGNNEARR